MEIEVIIPALQTQKQRCQDAKWLSHGGVVWSRVMTGSCLSVSKDLASPTVPDCTRAVVPQTSHSWAALCSLEGSVSLYINPPELGTIGVLLLGLNMADEKVKAC